MQKFGDRHKIVFSSPLKLFFLSPNFYSPRMTNSWSLRIQGGMGVGLLQMTRRVFAEKGLVFRVVFLNENTSQKVQLLGIG